MISSTNKTKGRISTRTTRMYYVLMDDGNPVGVCTTLESARVCLDEYTSKHNGAGKLEDMDVYVYEDSSGGHMITIRVVPRMKTA